MRLKLAAAVLMALAFVIPAAPALAQAGAPVLNENCQPVERKVFKDIRELVTIDLDTATDTQVRVLANQILSVTTAESLPVLPKALQRKMDGTPEELRAFLKNDMLNAWTTDLRISIARTIVIAGPAVQAAANKVLAEATFDAYLAYLNEGVYAARELDCASQPSTSPSVPTSPAPTESGVVVPVPSTTPGTSDGEGGGGLPVTGAAGGTIAAIGGALLLIGGAGYLLARRRRARFVA